MTTPVVIDGWCTLYHADCLEVLPSIGVPVDAVITDPPYSSGGTFRGDRMGDTDKKYFGQGEGQISEIASMPFQGDTRDQRSWGYWCTMWLSMARVVTKKGGIAAVFCDWRQLPMLTDSMQAAGWVWRGVAVWDKTEAARPQKGRYRAQSEFIVWGSNGPLRTDGPAAPGVFRESVGRERNHPTGKPQEVLQGLLSICGPRILDPFMGGGSMAVACALTDRKFVGVEIERRWFDVQPWNVSSARRATARSSRRGRNRRKSGCSRGNT